MAKYEDDDSEDEVPQLVQAAGQRFDAPQQGTPTAMSTSGQDPVKVTIITGFLGSGKSTLVRRVLTERHGLRVLVIENEFGDSVSSSIETAVVTPGNDTASGLAELIELPNGCVCCAASGDLADALGRLLRQDGPRRFDHVLVETSGLADPGPVAASLWVDEQLETSLRLDAVVAVADAALLPTYLSEQPQALPGNESAGNKAALARKQIAVADVVLFNKCDIVDKDPLRQKSMETSLLALSSPGAKVFRTTHCDAPLDSILNVHGYDETRIRMLEHEAMYAGPAVHPHGVGAVSIVLKGHSFDRTTLDHLVGRILWEDRSQNAPWGEVWRLKALATVEGEASPRLYQAVHTLFDSEPGTAGAGESGDSRFVFIGMNLARDKLESMLVDASATAKA